MDHDTIIIGGGLAGCACAFELSKYEGRVLLLEKNNDVADETTKANSAILHAGYDPLPDTLMAKYNVWGNEIVPDLCEDLDVACQNVGSLVVAFHETQIETLNVLKARGQQNGVAGLRIIMDPELHELEPALSESAIAALYAPTACIFDAWNLAIACMECAVANGTELHLNEEVTGIRQIDNGFEVITPKGTYTTSTLINAAGVECDKVFGYLADPGYEILPNKGEYLLLDKSEGPKASHAIFQCPDEKGKGVLTAPTVHGNLIAGPTSVVCDVDDTSTTTQGLETVMERAARSVPSIDFSKTIRTFAGVRARKAGGGDFIVGDEDIPGFYQIAALCSPGLSSANAIAIDITRMIREKGLFEKEKEDVRTTRHIPHFSQLNKAKQEALIKKSPAYGRVICRCETITEGEIVEVLHRPFVCASLDAIKRRCNAGMGRCQGGFCGPRVQEIIARELGISMVDVLKDKAGSVILLKDTRDDNESTI